jgi:hypothetical protein
MADQRHRPAVAFLRQHHAAALAVRGRRNDRGDVTLKVFAAAAEEPRGVAQRDFDPLFVRFRVAERCEPLRAVRTAPGGVDYEVRGDLSAGALDAG